MTETIHVSVAWPYANGDLHVGHLAGAYLPADIFARYQRLKGNRVLMVSGSDAHGTPITVTAEKLGISPREVFETNHRRFLETQQKIGISYDLFTHTDTENHYRVSQDFFLGLKKAGALYEETQALLFDEEANRFLPDRMVEGTCPHCGYDSARGDQCDNCGHLIDAVQLINPRSKQTGNKPIIRETTHYFLDLAKFKDQLHEYLSDKDYWRPNVIKFARNMVDDLRGRPITRDISWGIPVPLEGWEDKCLYVWFEAVIGYFSASIEWSKNNDQPEAWKDWWYNPDCKMYNFIGKDNIPFHTVIWQAELMGVSGIYNDDTGSLVLPYDVPANEYMNVQGAQFSKSRNWAVWLPDILERYDPDAIRYYVGAVLPETRDSDFTWEDFVARNNNELVAWWGNLVNRVLKFAYKNWDGIVPDPGELRPDDKALLEKIEAGFKTVGGLLDEVKLRRALEEAMSLAREVNVYLDGAPWFSVVKEDKQAAAMTVYTALQAITYLKTLLAPFLPFTAQQLHELLGFDGQVFGEQVIEEIEESTRNHGGLTYDGSAAIGTWEPVTLPPGQALKPPVALFKKLDEKTVIETETARLGN
ncbi:MAG: methionine--tRNA ligase [Anaerolineae bacterium]|nr:methionine--tRNA ligase [Anaerolineae bacterium]